MNYEIRGDTTKIHILARFHDRFDVRGSAALADDGCAALAVGDGVYFPMCGMPRLKTVYHEWIAYLLCCSMMFPKWIGFKGSG